MKTIKDKYLVVGADFAGYPLKEAVVAHLKEKGWKITDLGVTAESDPNDTENMFHRVGLRVGAEISEGNYERARETQIKLLPLIKALFSEVNPIPVKKAMNLLGFSAGEPRLPLTPMEEETAAKLAEAMRTLSIID